MTPRGPHPPGRARPCGSVASTASPRPCRAAARTTGRRDRRVPGCRRTSQRCAPPWPRETSRPWSWHTATAASSPPRRRWASSRCVTWCWCRATCPSPASRCRRSARVVRRDLRAGLPAGHRPRRGGPSGPVDPGRDAVRAAAWHDLPTTYAVCTEVRGTPRRHNVNSPATRTRSGGRGPPPVPVAAADHRGHHHKPVLTGAPRPSSGEIAQTRTTIRVTWRGSAAAWQRRRQDTRRTPHPKAGRAERGA
ncbi:hypothetical protein SCANM124S_01151 [Streptomyces canus]